MLLRYVKMSRSICEKQLVTNFWLLSRGTVLPTNASEYVGQVRHGPMKFWAAKVNIRAKAGTDRMVKVWTCQDVQNAAARHGEKNGWICEFNLDHARFLRRGVATLLGYIST
jgi:hypothetical protein